MAKIRLDIQTISTITMQSSQQQDVLKDHFLSGIAAVDQRIARVEETEPSRSGSSTPF